MDDKLALLLKEYDALRKEADQSIALMPEIAKSVGVAVAGALIGLKAGRTCRSNCSIHSDCHNERSGGIRPYTR
jgi:hypothetical protein